jgi:hypothetical protein
MRFIKNPEKGAPIEKVAFKRDSDPQGYFYSLKVGDTLRFEDDMAKFFTDTYPFLEDVTNAYTSDKSSPDEAEKVPVVKPDGETPRPINRIHHPERNRFNQVDDELEGSGLEKDTAEGFRAPRSRYSGKKG